MSGDSIPRPRAVLFDLDDTLIDSSAARVVVYRGIYDRHSAINEASTWDDALTFFQSFESDGFIDGEGLGCAIIDRWHGVELDPVAYTDWLSIPVAKHAMPLEGVTEFLASVNRAAMPWGVVTNGRARQAVKLHASGLADIVPFAVISMVFGANKPDPLIYHEAVRRLKISFPGIKDMTHSEVLFVGDNPHTDITGAFAVGMRTAWVHKGREYPPDVPKPDLVIGSVTELGDLLIA